MAKMNIVSAYRRFYARRAQRLPAYRAEARRDWFIASLFETLRVPA